MSDKQVIAAIDVGSASIKMLAAEISGAGFSVIPPYRTSAARLQAGLKPDMTLDEAALKRGEDAITELASHAKELGAVLVRAYGTSALRDALNSDVLVERVRERCGVELRVIPGEVEAASSFLAVSPKERSAVVNPGGGSTEITVGKGSIIEKAVSVHTGAVALSKICSPAEPDVILKTAAAYMKDALETPDIYVGIPVILSGGGATCAAAVMHGIDDIHSYAGHIGFELDKAESLFYELCSMPLEARRALKGMEPSRADILPYGIAILTSFMRFAGTKNASVTLRNNLYGFLQMMTDEINA